MFHENKIRLLVLGYISPTLTRIRHMKHEANKSGVHAWTKAIRTRLQCWQGRIASQGSQNPEEQIQHLIRRLGQRSTYHPYNQPACSCETIFSVARGIFRLTPVNSVSLTPAAPAFTVGGQPWVGQSPRGPGLPLGVTNWGWLEISARK